MKRLGELEAAVMDQLWSHSTATQALNVHAIVENLRDQREFAYTTILTVVSNLHTKGWVDREKRGRAYFYRPARSRAEAAAIEIRGLLNDSGEASTVLLYLGRVLSDHEADAVVRGIDLR